MKEKILKENGIISDLEVQRKPSVFSCPRSTLVNAMENKYCSGCSYPLTPKGYED